LAEKTLKALQAEVKEKFQGVREVPGFAAGVAVGHSHSPLYRLARTSEMLCRSAKRMLAGMPKGGDQLLALDWQFGDQVDVIDLGAVRERELGRFVDGQPVGMTARPYLVGDSRQGYPLLDQVVGKGKIVEDLIDGVWKDRRNKLGELRDVLFSATTRQGAEQSISSWFPSQDLPNYLKNAGFQTFWDREGVPWPTCNVVADALELVDLYWPGSCS
jgi:hypothetical protein